MRKLYNVDLPVPSSYQSNSYQTHIIYAPDSIDTDSQNSEPELTNEPINTLPNNQTSAFFKNLQFSLSSVSRSTVKAYNYLLMNSMRESPASSKSGSSLSLNSLSNIQSTKMFSSSSLSHKDPNELGQCGLSNILHSSQIERYSFYLVS